MNQLFSKFIFDEIIKIIYYYDRFNDTKELSNDFFFDKFFNLIYPNLQDLFLKKNINNFKYKSNEEIKNDKNNLEIKYKNNRNEDINKYNKQKKYNDDLTNDYNDDLTNDYYEIPHNKIKIPYSVEKVIDKLYKKISKIIHPDKATKKYNSKIYSDLFIECNKYYNSKQITKLINIAMKLNIDLNFIELNDEILIYIINEIINIINFIIINKD